MLKSIKNNLKLYKINYFKIKSKFLHSYNLNKLLLLWVFLVFIFVTINKLPSLPQKTHELAAFILNSSCKECGLGHVANSLIISPVYYLMSFFLMSLKKYLIIQCVFFASSLYIFYRILIDVFRNESVLINLSLTIILILLVFNAIGAPWQNIPYYLGIGVNFFNYDFSPRSIIALSFLISCHYLINKKMVFSGIFFLLGMLSHPTNGLVIFISFFGLIIFNFFKNLGLNSSDIKKLLFFLVLSLIPIIIKLITLDSIIGVFQSQEVSRSEYISSMYRDEIDDFSALFTLFSNKILLTLSLVFSVIPIVIAYLFRRKLKEIHKIKILSILIIVPVLIFFSIICIETIYSFFGLFEFLIEKIINSQLGHRILQYSGIPALLIWAILIKEIFDYSSIIFPKTIKNSINSICILIFIISSSLIIKSNSKIRINEFFNILSIENGDYSENGRMVYYEDLLISGYDKDLVDNQFFYDCKCGNIYAENIDVKEIEASLKTSYFNSSNINKEISSSFLKNYENYDSRKIIIKKIKNILKKGSKIIVPPYFYCFREFLPHYDIYFQEHDDGNFMLGSKKIYEKFKPRMVSLSIPYLELPSQQSKLMVNEIRNKWLNLNETDFKIIESQGFNYIITEAKHKINFKVLYQDENWKIYQTN